MVQVTARQAVIRHPLGYTFCVTRAQIFTGSAKVTFLSREEVTRMEDARLMGDARLSDFSLKELCEAESAQAPNKAPTGPSPTEQEAPTPLEALQRGIPLSQARVMTPADLTRETAEELLAAGVAKREIMRLYGYRSSQGFFGKLQKWGLHASAKAKSRQGAPVTRGKEISLEEAVSRLDRARENLKSVTLIINQQKDLLTEEVAALLIKMETEFTKEVRRYETALKNTKVVI